VSILSDQRKLGAARLSRARLRPELPRQPMALAESERERLSALVDLAAKAGITAGLPDLLRDPRMVPVLAGHFRVPTPSVEACRRHYHEHQEEFREPDRHLGRQIVLPLGSGDIATQPEVWARAERIIAILSFSPRMFPDLLVSYGAAERSGQLGPVARGALPGPLDVMFFTLRPGEICPVPIATDHGVHVVLLDRIIPGELAPFAAVQGKVSFLLRQEMRHAAAARHLTRLAERYDAAAPGFA
jgi:peptidyl-prolyl cis-trans isomerase C